MGAIITWWNPLRCEKDYEEFDSMDDAMAELEKWKVDYPWNTYTVAAVVMVHSATTEWVSPFRYEGAGTIVTHCHVEES